MKDIEGDSKSILALFEKEEKRIVAESRQREAEAMKELKKQDVAHGEIVKRLAVSEETLARLKGEYLSLEKKVKVECDAEVERLHISPDQVRAGTKTLDALYRSGKNETEIRRMKAESAATELADALRMVRQSQVGVWQLRQQKAEVEANISYLAAEPARSQMTRLKAHVVSLEQRIGPIISQQNSAASEAVRLREMLGWASGEDSIQMGHYWDSLSIQGVRDLLFNPMLRDSHLQEFQTVTLPEIETREAQRIATGTGPGIYRVELHVGGWGASGRGLSWLPRDLSDGSRAMALSMSGRSEGKPIERGDALSMTGLKPKEDEK